MGNNFYQQIGYGGVVTQFQPSQLTPPSQFLPNLVLALRADTGVVLNAAGLVVGWTDRSPSAAHASAPGGVTGPAFSATGGPNGTAAIGPFGPATYLDNVVNGLMAFGSARTVLAVIQATLVGGTYVCIRRGLPESDFLYYNLAGTSFVWSDNQTANQAMTTVIDGNPHVIVTRYNLPGVLVDVRLDGVEQTISGATTTFDTGTPDGYTVGQSEGSSIPFDGTLMEVNVCNADLSLAQVQRYEQYVHARYGFAVAGA